MIAATTWVARVLMTLALASAGAAVLASQAGAYVYWGSAAPERIVRANPDGSQQVAIPASTPVFGVEARDGELWWANPAAGTIGRVDADGSDAIPSFIAGGSTTRDVAVDDAHIYWARSTANAIGRANRDGNGVQQSFITTSASASAIAVDDQHLYWASSTGGTIGRANLDGSGVQESFMTVGGTAVGIAIDDQHLYWTNPATGTIGRANLDGTGAVPGWITGASVPNGIAVDGQHVWWINGSTNTVARANLDGSNPNQSYITGLNGSTGIAVDPYPLTPTVMAAAAPASSVFGDAVSVRATLSDGIRASGPIELRLHQAGDTTCSQPPLFTDTVQASGDGSYDSATYTPPRAGSYRWVVSYGGDTLNRAVTTACGAAGSIVTVDPRAWDLSLAAAPAALTVVGEPLHAVAGLDDPADPSVAPGPQSPTGSAGLTFQLFGPDDATCSQRPLLQQSVPLTNAVAGQYATGTFTPTAPGAYRWTVALSDADNEAPAIDCADGAIATVERATPQLTVAASPGIELGGVVTASAALAGGYELGSGAIAFSLYGPEDPTCTAPPLFTSTVAAEGDGSYRAAAFTPERAGTHRWVVAYAGDARNGAVTTACADAAAAVLVAPRPEPPAPPPPPHDPGPPPPAPPPLPPAPLPPAVQPAISRFALAARCVRPAADGRVTVGLRLRTARAGSVQVVVQRALGTRGMERCPATGGSGRFDGRYRTVTTLRDARTRPTAAARAASARAATTRLAHAASGAPTAGLTRRLTLRLRLEPALYRITVRARTADGRLSAPKRRYLRVLAPR